MSRTFILIQHQQLISDLFFQIYSLPSFNKYIHFSNDRQIQRDDICTTLQSILDKLSLLKSESHDDQIKSLLNKSSNLTFEEYSRVVLYVKSNFIDYFIINNTQISSFSIANELYNMLLHKKDNFLISSSLVEDEVDPFSDLFEKFLFDISEKRKEIKMIKETKRICVNLFKKFDIDEDGFITEKELINKLISLRLPKAFAKEIFNQADSQKDGKISISEFESYIESKILKFYKVFYSLDINNDMELSPDEIKLALHKVFPHIEINDILFKRLYKSIDGDKNGNVTLEEWCQFLLLFPEENYNYIANLHNIFAATASMPGESDFNMIDFDMEIKDKSVKFSDILKNFFCGAFSGGISRTITAPLENLKVMYQSEYTDKKPPNILRGLLNLYENKGIVGFFKGNSLSIFISCFEQALRFAIIDYSKKNLQEQNGFLSAKTLFYIGLTTGIMSSIFLYPLEVVRIRMISSMDPSQRILEKFKIIYSEKGIKSFYSGYIPHIISVLPSGSCHVVLYNTLKRLFVNQQDYENLNMNKFMFLGGFAGIITGTFTYPLNIITTRTIVENKYKDATQRISFISITRRTFYNEGFSGFYKGWLPSILRVSLGQGINFGIFETMRGYIK